MKIVIFACVHNAGRSQMASAFFNRYAKTGEAKAISAGTEPASKVHPEVLTVMLEKGFNLFDAKPTLLTQQLAEEANLLITMGCGERCPYVPGLKIIDWKLEDPKGQELSKVRATRDHIEKMVLNLIKENGWHL